jgi:hypothetical protein
MLRQQAIIFFRKATKKEKHSAYLKRQAFIAMPEKQNFEKVYMPYGLQGAGFYFVGGPKI